MALSFFISLFVTYTDIANRQTTNIFFGFLGIHSSDAREKKKEKKRKREERKKERERRREREKRKNPVEQPVRAASCATRVAAPCPDVGAARGAAITIETFESGPFF